MSMPQSLSDRVAKLRQRKNADGAGGIPSAEPIPGDWPQHCLAFPASYAQSRLWFLHQLQPDLTAYHIPAVWRLRGDIDLNALRQALAGLIERHSTLRTSFCLHGSEVVQLIHPPAPFPLELEPLGDRNPDAVIEQWLEQEHTTPFDLASGRLIRARLLAVDHQHHLLLLNHHHIASDGWSLSVFARDLSELYNARRSGRSAELAPLRVKYHDYAAWQRQRLSGDRLQSLQDYWIPQLKGLEPLEFPSDHPRPATPSHRGASVAFQITPELLAPFEELCRSEGATLQMGLLAVVALLLHRTSRQDGFAIGVPIWGRNHSDLEPLIGFFINTLPIRTRFTAQQSFRQLLQEVKASSLAAYDHQEIPFEQIVEALNLPRDTSRNALLQVMFQLIELPEASLESLEDLSVEAVHTGVETSKFELEFYLYRSSKGARAKIIYATDLFSEERINRLSSHLLSLIASALNTPDSPACSLHFVTDAEHLLIESWLLKLTDQHTEATRDARHPGYNEIITEIQVYAKVEPTKVAIATTQAIVTYADLISHCEAISKVINDGCIRKGSIIAILSASRLETILGMLACYYCQRAFVVVDPSAPISRIEEILVEIGYGPIITSKSSTSELPKRAAYNRPQISIGFNQNRSLDITYSKGVSEQHDLEAKTSHDLAYAIFTSGSTGKPKGVLIGRNALECFTSWAGKEFEITSKDTVLQFSSLTFDACIEEIFPALKNGATISCRDDETIGNPERILRFIEEQKITIASFPTAFWAELVSSCAKNNFHIPSGLRLIIIGGEELTSRQLQMWKSIQAKHTRLINTYGPTEATVEVTWLDVNDSRLEGNRGSLGRPVPYAEVRVVDQYGQLCPLGIPGELWIGGPSLAQGYLNNPGLTKEKFIVHRFSNKEGTRLYKTGDLVSWNPDGTLTFHGRIDQQIKLRGFRIEPGDIEAHLLAHPAIAQAIVLLRHDDPNNPRLIAYWVADASQPSLAASSSDQLRAYLADRLPDYMMPAAFLQLEALPLTPNGKLDRKALPAPSFSGNPDQRVAPSTDLEQQLHAIWAEVLGHSGFGIADNFFAIGGHSLAAARLVSRIEQAIGSAPTLAALFQNPSIAGLTPLLGASSTEAEAQPISSAEPIAGDWPQHCQVFPASYAQSRLWFLHQLEPDLTAYHLTALWRLSGNLDLKALCLALADLIERHPSLRTSFCLQGSAVVQLIHPPAPFSLDVEVQGDCNPDAVIEQWLEQERTTPFDLSSGRLIRARLLAVDHQHHLLLVNHHHIASDGWSRSVLTRDLTELYNAHRSGRASELVPLQVLYHDYAAWQRQRLSGDRLQSLKDYWIPQLIGLEPLELPSDHPRPATPSHRGGSVAFQITPDLLAPFEQLCRLEGATLQMSLLALVALLLHRYSRQDDFAIGVPIWGRNHPDLEPLIGFFINTLPIRTRFTAHQSFRQLLQQVKATSLAAYDHQELPFEQIVEALNLPRDTSRNPLVQVMFQLVELPEASLQGLAELESEVVVRRPSAAKLDLEFYLRRTEQGGLWAEVVYAAELFDEDRIARMSSHLLTLLASALEQPDVSADSLCLLPDGQRQLIESWQHGPTIDVPDLCVHQLFEQQVERTPDAIALIFENQQLTYNELNSHANQLAHQFIDLGVGPEIIAAVCLERSVELIVSLLAILKAGGAYLPIDPSWPEERHALLLKEAACSVMINQDGATVVEDSSLQGEAASGSPLAYVSYTSGSTGKPKGVAISHQSILRLVDPVNGFLLSAGHRVLQLAPVAFDAATFEIWGPLLNGGTLVVAPSEQPTLPALAALLKNHGITTLWLTAGLFHAMVEAELPALAGVQQILAGGDVLSCEHVQRLLDAFPPGHELINGYGPTENTTFTCCQHFTAAATVDPNGVPIGRPIANTDVWVLDEGGQPCPIGIPGELHIGGGGLARGYLNNSELTAETFIPDPFSSDPTARLYKSGDLASWNPDGTLSFHGRIDQQIKLRGFRIEPGEIEANLLAHPAVAQAVVLLRRDDPNNPRLIAYWVAVASQPSLAASSSEQLRAFLADRLPDYMVPAAFLQLEGLPLTPNGKLDRKALPTPSFSGNLEQLVAPSSDLERQLHAIWAEVLGHSDFGITDNFFAIGGHSLAAARLVSQIEMVIGSSPALASIFHNPTISGLAQLIQGRVSSSSSLLVTLQPKGSRPPLFVIHGWGGTVWGFVDLARALAPERPVYGIQAPNVELGLSQKMNVREMAMEYADQILASRPKGRIHLLGFSAGGWYAHAVAEALLERGADLGFLGVLDTGPTTLIHRRIGIILLSWHLSSRLTRHFTEFIRSRDSSRSRYVLGRLQAVKALIIQYLHVDSRPSPGRERPPEGGSAKEDLSGDPFVELLYSQYRPKRLPIQVDIFAPKHALPRLKMLWSFYARKGARCHPIFSRHHDFVNPDKSLELAAALELALTSLE